MAKIFEIDNSTLLPIKEAAKKVSYSRDYVARLAREKKIAASQVGRQWFVDLTSLKNFAEAAELEQKIKKQNLSDKRKKDLQLKQELKSLNTSLKQKRKSSHLYASLVSSLVLCFGLLSGVAIYHNDGIDTFLASTPFSATLAGIDAGVSTPLNGNDTEDYLAEKDNNTFFLATSTETIIAEASTPFFVDEVETRNMGGGVEGIFLLSEDSEVRTKEQVEALFSDEVFVEFSYNNEGVVIMEGEDGELKEYPFVSVPDDIRVTEVFNEPSG